MPEPVRSFDELGRFPTLTTEKRMAWERAHWERIRMMPQLEIFDPQPVDAFGKELHPASCGRAGDSRAGTQKKEMK